MLRAAEAAREGNAQYFTTLPSEELTILMGRRDEDGRSLIHNAAVGGNLTLMQLLIDRGCTPLLTGTDPEGWTPLLSAVSCGHEDISRLLLSLGVDPNTANKQGRTALHYAASKGRTALIQVLLQSGASPTSKDCTGSIPLHRAAGAGRLEAVKLLLQATPKHLIDARDASGATPLLVAAIGGHQSSAILLAGSGADVEAADRDEETPLGAAASHGQLRQALVDIATGEKTLHDFELEL